MSDRPDDPWLPGGPVAVDATEVRRGGGAAARLVAIGVGAALLLGGVAFAATQVGGREGAGSAEAAVSELFDALADEDVVGVLASLDPGERDTLTEPAQQLFEELERLEVVDDSFELGGVSGVDLEFEGLTFRTEPILDGLARVHVTGGTASYAVDGAELPVGDFVADTLERLGVDHTTFTDEDRDDALGAGDDFLVARETDDGWRVSVGYTAAEAARLASGSPVPATGMAALGAESPEAAVEGFLRAAADVDVRGLVARLSPDEFRALQHYWPVLVDESTLPTAEDLGATIELTELELDAATDGDHARVSIRSIGADVTTEDFRGGATIADGCATLRGDVLDEVIQEVDLDDDRICLEELDELLEEASADLDGMGFGRLGIAGLDPLAIAGSGQLDVGITATRVDGRWYVAPIRTFADAGIAALRAVDREDLEAAVDAVESFFGSDFFSGGAVGGGFIPPGMADDGLEDLGEPLFPDDGAMSFDTEAGTVDARTSGLVEELVSMVSGDADVAGCVLFELQATATPEQLVALADAYEQGLASDPAAEQVLFDALDACGG